MRVFSVLFLILFSSITFGYSYQGGDTPAITISAVGDIMIGTWYPNRSYLPPDSGKDIFNGVKDYLEADIVFGNLEGTLCDKRIESKKCRGREKSACYVFKMPESFGKIISDAGFSLLSIANNHIWDFGEEGMRTTVKTLEANGFNYAGTEDIPFCEFEANGLKIGFIAFSPNRRTNNMNDYPCAAKMISALKQENDIVIVSFHGGGEGSKYRHVTGKKEYYFSEYRGNVNEFAHLAVDAGADLVLGHGPHVSRAVEVYKGRLIAYSLGNFCTYGRFNLQGSNGVAPILKAKLNARGEFIEGNIISIKQIGRGIPVADDGNTALKEIIKLTDEDIPENGIIIDETGVLMPAGRATNVQ